MTHQVGRYWYHRPVSPWLDDRSGAERPLVTGTAPFPDVVSAASDEFHVLYAWAQSGPAERISETRATECARPC